MRRLVSERREIVTLKRQATTSRNAAAFLDENRTIHDAPPLSVHWSCLATPLVIKRSSPSPYSEETSPFALPAASWFVWHQQCDDW